MLKMPSRHSSKWIFFFFFLRVPPPSRMALFHMSLSLCVSVEGDKKLVSSKPSYFQQYFTLVKIFLNLNVISLNDQSYLSLI